VSSWLYHLPNRPTVVAPYAPRIFKALEALQDRERDHSDNGKNLAQLGDRESLTVAVTFRSGGLGASSWTPLRGTSGNYGEGRTSSVGSPMTPV